VYCTELSWLTRFRNEREGGSLEETDEVFDFALGAGANIPAFVEFFLLNLVVRLDKIIEGRVVGRGIGALGFWNPGIESKLDAMAQGGINLQKTMAL
jgi:hypothetical protein